MTTPSTRPAVGLDPAQVAAAHRHHHGRQRPLGRARGKERIEGHARGAKSVDVVTEECCRLGIGQLTLYCLSSENWKRPKPELDFLMALLKQYLLAERPKILEQNIRFTVIGRRDGLPDEVLAEIDENIRLSRDNTGLDALPGDQLRRPDRDRRCRAGDRRPRRTGRAGPGRIDEATISDSLYTAGMPDPDLLIRTAGEMRVSNYLLWQISYAELWVTPKCWPDFDAALLHEALRDFARRERRFGGLKPTKARHDASPPKQLALNDRHAGARRLAPRPRGRRSADRRRLPRPVVPLPVRLPHGRGVVAGRELVRLFPEPYRPSRIAGRRRASCFAWRPTGIRRARLELGYELGSVVAVPGVRLHRTTHRARSCSRCTAIANPAVVPRLGATLLAVAYLGLLPCFFVQIRFLETSHTGLMLATHDPRPEVQRHRGVLHRHVPRPDQDDAAPQPEEDLGRIRGRHDRRHTGGGDRGNRRFVVRRHDLPRTACWKRSRSAWRSASPACSATWRNR